MNSRDRTRPLARLDDGALLGVTSGGIDSWRGIPYAAAPVGDLRLRAPVPPVPWKNVRDSSRFGIMSAQLRRVHLGGARSIEGSGEDCLTINVHAPSHRPAGPPELPVMVFIHGGGYSGGSSRDFSEHGDAFIRTTPVVYVSFNYRLGPLGYLDFTRFSTTAHPFDSNLGLRDQIMALRWVRDNIAAFGGDPGNVTIFGESAGANAVTTLMATPTASGLFHRAIVQSAPPEAVYFPEATAEWASEFVAVLSQRLGLGIDRSDASSVNHILRSVDVDDLIQASSVLQATTPDAHPGTFCLAPVVDGVLLPEHPMAAFQSGHAHRVPLIIGTNAREGTLFRGRMDITPRSPSRIHALFEHAPQSAWAPMHAAYPGLPAPREATDFGGDYGFWYPSTRVADFHSRYAPVWAYRFDVAPTVLKLVGLDATHGLEMYTLFDQLDAPIARVFTSLGGRRAYASAGGRMRANWVRFAATGAPTASWPRYSIASRSTLIIDEVDRVENDPQSQRRLAWDGFLPHLADPISRRVGATLRDEDVA